MYALGFAFFSSINILLAKKIMGKLDEYAYLLFSTLFILPFTFSISIILFGLPKLDLTFLGSTFLAALIAACAAILAYRAIRISEISLVNPISSFHPIFTGIISSFTLKEIITTKGWVGIIIVVVGAYVLKVGKSKEGLFVPVKALVSHKGVRLSFVAYLLWAISPTFEKTAIFHTTPNNPPFVAVVESLVAAIIYSVVLIKKSENLGKIASKAKTCVKQFLAIGILGGVGTSLAFLAIGSGKLGPVTSVFRLSMIFTVLWGGLFFKEKNFKNRLLGSIIMLLGVVLLVS